MAHIYVATLIPPLLVSELVDSHHHCSPTTCICSSSRKLSSH